MLRLLVIVLGVILTPLVHSAEPKKTKFTFTIDGKPFEPDVISLSGNPDDPKPGDLFRVDDFWLVLDDETKWDLVNTGRDDGLLYRKRGNEREVVAVNVTTTFKGDERALINPLTKMTREEKIHLRGLRLDAWDDAIAKSLAGIDLAKTALSVSDMVHDAKRALPGLPVELRFLLINERSNQGIRDYSRLADLKSLAVLSVRSMTADMPATHIGTIKGLRHLECNNLDPKGMEGLEKLTQLRTLRIPYSGRVKDISFVRNCPELVEIDLRGTAVTDLRPLEGLKKLVTVRGDNARISELPQRMPGLRRLDVFSTDLTDEQMEAFRKANPECVVRHRWVQAMRDSVNKADRIRIRTGGTCHRNVAEEKMLLELKDAIAIRELVATIAIDESHSDEHCMCCGDPSIEFYEGDRLVLTLGFHHGRSLRWVGGWPSDGVLAGDSAEKLCKWMAEKGVREPLRAFEQNSRQESIARRRMKMIEEAIPKDVMTRLKSAKSREEAMGAFEEGIADATNRGHVYFRMIGIGDGSWNHSFGPDELVIRVLLPRMKAADVAAAAKAAKDATALSGAGRWLFSERKWSELPKETLDDVVKTVAAATLSHPKLLNRRQTMEGLKEIGSAPAKELLRKVFDGKIEIRKLSKEDEAEAPGTVSFRPKQDELERGSDAAQAARLLAECGDRSIREEVEKRMQTAKGDDKTIYESVLQKISKSP